MLQKSEIIVKLDSIQPLEISDKEIDIVAHDLGLTFGDADRKALRCMVTSDIQACPGSGKTMLLVAKLAILSTKWGWRDRGICVLSHTNVARTEIEKRLTNSPGAYHILNYPHFVGTIQSFIDQYLAIPYLACHGVEVRWIDNDRFGQSACKFYRQYCKSAQGYLSHKHNPEEIVRSLRYQGADLKLVSSVGLPSENSSTYKELARLKKTFYEDGVFRFDDMYAFADAFIKEHPESLGWLRHRFPLVFIDEMQDTNAVQETILTQVFSSCIVQRLGDANQAIFATDDMGGTSTNFAKAGFLELPESRRFGQQIADFASRLTAEKPQKLRGNPNEPSRLHTIFLFNEQTIQNVLPSFANLISSQCGNGIPSLPIKAVGFRKAEPNTGVGLPRTISDYWKSFQPELVSQTNRLNRFIDYLRRSRCIVEKERECRDAYGCFFEGVLELLKIQNATDSDGMRFRSKGRFVRALAADGKLAEFQRLMSSMCLSSEPVDGQVWERSMSELKRILVSIVPNGLVAEAIEFISWTDSSKPCTESLRRPNNDSNNIFLQDGVKIEVTTIHSVKGQTHFATLVLETYYNKQYDLQKLVPFLKGGGTPNVQVDSSIADHMKRIFVAITRPTALVCLAMHAGHVSPSDLKGLETSGWLIHDLRETGKAEATSE